MSNCKNCKKFDEFPNCFCELVNCENCNQLFYIENSHCSEPYSCSSFCFMRFYKRYDDDGSFEWYKLPLDKFCKLEKVKMLKRRILISLFSKKINLDILFCILNYL